MADIRHTWVVIVIPVPDNMFFFYFHLHMTCSEDIAGRVMSKYL